MKRVLCILSIVVFFGAVLASCKSTKSCPAYGNTSIEKVDVEV